MFTKALVGHSYCNPNQIVIFFLIEESSLTPNLVKLNLLVACEFALSTLLQSTLIVDWRNVLMFSGGSNENTGSYYNVLVTELSVKLSFKVGYTYYMNIKNN